MCVNMFIIIMYIGKNKRSIAVLAYKLRWYIAGLLIEIIVTENVIYGTSR